MYGVEDRTRPAGVWVDRCSAGSLCLTSVTAGMMGGLLIGLPLDGFADGRAGLVCGVLVVCVTAWWCACAHDFRATARLELVGG